MYPRLQLRLPFCNTTAEAEAAGTLDQMARARIVFRVLIAATLVVMMIPRFSGGRMNHALRAPFSSWFLVSVFVFGAFGIVSAWRAFREPRNRQAFLTDVVLAAAWIPYWSANLQRVPGLFR